MKRFLIMLIAAIGFVGCAPMQMGSSAFTPITSTLDRPATVTAGGTWYIKTDSFLAAASVDLKTRDDALDSLFFSSDIAVGTIKTTGVNWLTYRDAVLPEGWQVELANQIASREIVEVGTTSYSFRDKLDLVFAVRVPASAQPGSYPLLVAVSSRSNPGLNIPVLFSVRIEAK